MLSLTGLRLMPIPVRYPENNQEPSGVFFPADCRAREFCPPSYRSQRGPEDSKVHSDVDSASLSKPQWDTERLERGCTRELASTGSALECLFPLREMCGVVGSVFRASRRFGRTVDWLRIRLPRQPPLRSHRLLFLVAGQE